MIDTYKWVWDHVNDTSLRSRHTEVAKSDTVRIVLSGGLLIIPFHIFLLRNPQTAGENGVIIDNEWLQKIAEWAWDMQFQ